ncbi:MAG: NAD(P)H-hydrate dehydratase [Sedimentisphaerales bacterium]|nr:NAD(P)H-hydrate dehydratase [Sedimentisphaerales bacterium]
MNPTTPSNLPQLPPRNIDAHKGQFGKLLIVAGSRNMPGAAALVANAALRSGLGLARAATTIDAQQTIITLAPCATSIALPQDSQGQITANAVNTIIQQLSANDALAIGPGIGQSNDLQNLIATLLPQITIPTVIDADALNNLAALRRSILPLNTNTVLTPHPGEFGRLWSAWLRDPLPQDRTTQAQMLAQACGAIVVLKGAQTVVTNGTETYINTTGNPGMATAGAGDVLTGCIAALLAQNNTPYNAAVLATYIHGLAGDLAAQKLGQTAMIATDIIKQLPNAWQNYTSQRT